MIDSKLTAKQLDALEKIFACEINGTLPFQSKAKIYQQLVVDGLTDDMEMILPGRFAVRVKGYELTHRGRILYCYQCEDKDGLK